MYTIDAFIFLIAYFPHLLGYVYSSCNHFVGSLKLISLTVRAHASILFWLVQLRTPFNRCKSISHFDSPNGMSSLAPASKRYDNFLFLSKHWLIFRGVNFWPPNDC